MTLTGCGKNCLALSRGCKYMGTGVPKIARSTTLDPLSSPEYWTTGGGPYAPNELAACPCCAICWAALCASCGSAFLPPARGSNRGSTNFCCCCICWACCTCCATGTERRGPPDCGLLAPICLVCCAASIDSTLNPPCLKCERLKYSEL